MYRKVVSGGLSGFFGLVVLIRRFRVHWLGSYLWQQRGWGIVVTQGGIMLWRWNGFGVRSHSVVLNVDDKAILVYWSNKYLGTTRFSTWVYRVLGRNITLLFIVCCCFIFKKGSVIGLKRFQSVGGDSWICGRVKCLSGDWLIGQDFGGFNNLTGSMLRYIHISFVLYCDREASLFNALNEIWIVAKMKEQRVGVVMVILWTDHKGFHYIRWFLALRSK